MEKSYWIFKTSNLLAGKNRLIFSYDDEHQMLTINEPLYMDYLKRVCFEDQFTVKVPVTYQNDDAWSDLVLWMENMVRDLKSRLRFLERTGIGETFPLDETTPFSNKVAELFTDYNLIEPVPGVSGEYKVLNYKQL